MGRTVDDRIVRMEFDNNLFERNVKQSLSTLDKLKQSLNFKGVEKGFNNIEAAAKSVNLDKHMGGAIDKVKMSFSALEVVAMTTLSRITNTAITLGTKIASALTIDPVKLGFSEYETKMNAIQTIFANTKFKGTTMDDINGALDELNTYADKTIYNFTEMTRNIGTFTAAGVDLNTSVQAIKGLANLGGVSGSNPQQVATAMYQMSQMLSQGKMMLQDWNSLTNAGMGGELVKQSLIETAALKGVDVNAMISEVGSFRATLENGWLTSEIFLETLQKFSGDLNEEQLAAMGYTQDQIAGIMELGRTAVAATTEVKTFTQLLDTLREAQQSGWTQSWEIILGGFDEAKTMWTGVYKYFENIINGMADARNAILQEWKNLGGRDAMLNSFKNVWQALVNVIKPVRDAFREIFPRKTGAEWASLSKTIEKFTEKLILSDKSMERLKNTFRGVFTVINLIIKPIKIVAKVLFRLATAIIQPLVHFLLIISSAFGNLASKLSDFANKFKIFEKISNVMNKGVDYVIKFIQKIEELGVKYEILSTISNLLSKAFDNIKAACVGGFEYMKEKVSGFSDALKSSKDSFAGISDNMKELGSNAKEYLGLTGKAFKNLAEGAALDLGAISSAIGELIGKLEIGEKIKMVFSAIGDAVRWVKDLFSGINFGDLLDLTNAGVFGLLVLKIRGFVKTLSKLIESLTKPFDSFAGMFDNISGVLNTVRSCLEQYQKTLKSRVIYTIAKAIGVLAIAIIALSLVPADKLKTAVGAMSVMFADLAVMMFIINKIDFKGTAGIMGAMISFALSCLILASVVKRIGSMKPENMIQGVLGIAGLAVVLGLLVRQLSHLKKSIKGVNKITKTMISFALSCLILATVIKQIGNMKTEKMIQGMLGIVGLAVVMGTLVAVLSRLKKPLKNVGKTLISMSLTMLMLSYVMKIIGEMKTNELIKSVGALTALMISMGVFCRIASGVGKRSDKTASKILALSTGIVILSYALKEIGKMKLTDIGTALGTLTLVIGEFILFSKIINKGDAKKIKTLSKSIRQISIAMLILSASIKILGDIQIGQIVKCIGSIVALFGVMRLLSGSQNGIGLSGKTLLTMTATMIGIAFALKQFENIGTSTVVTGLIAIGGGLVVLALGLKMFAAVVPATATFETTAIGMLAIAGAALVFVTACQRIGTIGPEFGKGLIAMCDGVAQAAPNLITALTTLLIAGVVGLLNAIPELAEGLFKVLSRTFETLTKYTGQIAELLCKFLIKVFESIAKYGPEVIGAGVDALFSLLEGLFKAIGNQSPGRVDKLIVGMVKLVALFTLLAYMKKKFLDAMISIGLISVGMVVLSASLALISLMNTDGIVATCDALNGMIRSLALSIKLLSFIPISGAITAIASLSVFALGLTALLAVLGGLKQIPGCEWLISEGSEFLATLGYAIGNFVGSIAGGLMDGVTSGLPAVGQNLTDFMTNIQGFVEGAKQIDADAMEGVQALATAMLLISGGQILDAVASFISGGVNWEEFSAKVVKLGEALVAFSTSVEGIDSEDVEKAANAGLLLTKLADTVPNEGGLISWITGDNPIDEFAKKLPILAEGLVDFANKIKEGNFDPASVESAVNACKLLTELADTVPNEGGLLSWIVGDNSIEDFGNNLPILAEGLSEFSNKTKGITKKSVEGAVNATKMIIAMNEEIPETGGLWGLIAGDNDLSDFGDELESFGASLGGFAEKVKNINAEMMTLTIASIGNLGDTVEKLAKIDYTGLEPFLTCIGGFGEELFNFYDNVSAINVGALDVGVSAFSSISDMLNRLSTMNAGVVKDFVSSLKELGTISIVELAQSIQNGSPSVILALGKMFIGMKNAINTAKPQLRESFNSLVQEILTRLQAHAVNFENAGRRLVQALANGINTTNSGISSSFNGVLNSAVNKVRAYYTDFYIAGMHVARGFADGISDTTFLAVQKAGQMAGKAADKARQVLDEHSPSKVFYKIAAFAGIAFANGLGDYAKVAGDRGAELGEAAIIGTRRGIEMLKGIVQEGIDDEPVIKPVLDLSEVQNGFKQLNNNDYMRTTLGLAGSINIGRNPMQVGFDELRGSVRELVDGINTSNEQDKTYNFTSEVILDGKKVGRGVASYVDNEINRINRLNSRKGGKR